MINHTMVLTINVTLRSKKAEGLDDCEVSIFENKPGEYRGDLILRADGYADGLLLSQE